MRLVFLLPAFNEEHSITAVLSAIPRQLKGVDSIDILVIDDGSTDATVSCAKNAGAHVVSHPTRLGLAAAFRTGVSYGLRTGADLFVTLDADGQYDPADTQVLLDAFLQESADLVLGDRQVWTCTHMPLCNRIGNSVGSFMLRVLGMTGVNDASSGFRLFTRQTAEKIRITSEHTYTHEMLIQASVAGLKVIERPVQFLPRTHGKSKLVRTLRHHILRSCGTILRSLFLYRPLRKFLFAAAICFVCSVGFFLLSVRSAMRVDFAIASGVMFILAIQFVLIGVLADVHAAARRLLLEQDHLPSS